MQPAPYPGGGDGDRPLLKTTPGPAPSTARTYASEAAPPRKLQRETLMVGTPNDTPSASAVLRRHALKQIAPDPPLFRKLPGGRLRVSRRPGAAMMDKLQH